MYVGAGRRTSQVAGGTRARRDLAVQTHRVLGHNPGALRGHKAGIVGVECPRRRLLLANRDMNTGAPKRRDPLAGFAGVGVERSDLHGGNPGRPNRVRAGRCPPPAVTRLQRDVERRTPGRRARRAQRLHLRVILTGGLGPAGANDPVVTHHDGADCRIRTGPPFGALGQRERTLHKHRSYVPQSPPRSVSAASPGSQRRQQPPTRGESRLWKPLIRRSAPRNTWYDGGLPAPGPISRRSHAAGRAIVEAAK